MITLVSLENKKIKVSQIQIHEVRKLMRTKARFWIDLSQPSDEEIKTVAEALKLHPLVEEDLRKHGTRTKVEDYDDYIFLVTYALSIKDDEGAVQEFDFVASKRYVLSSHHVPYEEYEKLFEKKDILTRRLTIGTDYMLHKLMDILVDNYTPVLEKIEDQVEALEESATEDPRPAIVQKILEMKRTIIKYKRVIFAFREHSGLLAKGEQTFISKQTKAYYRDLYDHVIRASDQIDSYREIVSGAHEAYMSSLSNRMNEIMKTLSIIATIMLPLSLLTGFYGMNFKYFPGLDSPYGIWVLVGGMSAILLGMLVFFKVRKWF